MQTAPATSKAQEEVDALEGELIDELLQEQGDEPPALPEIDIKL